MTGPRDSRPASGPPRGRARALRGALLWGLGALGGIAVAVALTWTVGHVSGQRIGLGSQPASVIRGLAPRPPRPHLEPPGGAEAPEGERQGPSRRGGSGGAAPPPVRIAAAPAVSATASPASPPAAAPSGGASPGGGRPDAGDDSGGGGGSAGGGSRGRDD